MVALFILEIPSIEGILHQLQHVWTKGLVKADACGLPQSVVLGHLLPNWCVRLPKPMDKILVLMIFVFEVLVVLYCPSSRFFFFFVLLYLRLALLFWAISVWVRISKAI